MTRQEFIDEIQSISDFRDWCYDNDEDWAIEDWINEDYLLDEIDNDVREMIDNESWETLRDALNEVETDSDSGWFRKEGWLDYSPISEDELDDLKQSIIDRYDEGGYWDDEDDDDEGQTEGDDGTASGIDWDDWDAATETPEPAQPEREEEKTKTAIEIFLCGGE